MKVTSHIAYTVYRHCHWAVLCRITRPDVMQSFPEAWCGVWCAWRSESDEEYFCLGIIKTVDIFGNNAEILKWECEMLSLPKVWISTTATLMNNTGTGLRNSCCCIHKHFFRTHNKSWALVLGLKKKKRQHIFLLCKWVNNGWKKYNGFRASRWSCQASRGARKGNLTRWYSTLCWLSTNVSFSPATRSLSHEWVCPTAFYTNCKHSCTNCTM